MQVMSGIVEFDLQDMHSGNDSTHVKVHFGKDGICIHPEGTGIFDGDFSPIFIERYEGRVRVHIWADINQENPTHSIELDGALESARKK